MYFKKITAAQTKLFSKLLNDNYLFKFLYMKHYNQKLFFLYCRIAYCDYVNYSINNISKTILAYLLSVHNTKSYNTISSTILSYTENAENKVSKMSTFRWLFNMVAHMVQNSCFYFQRHFYNQSHYFYSDTFLYLETF